jgi:hypothetical protein
VSYLLDGKLLDAAAGDFGQALSHLTSLEDFDIGATDLSLLTSSALGFAMNSWSNLKRLDLFCPRLVISLHM